MMLADESVLPAPHIRLRRLLHVLLGLSLVMLVLIGSALIRVPTLSVALINVALLGYCVALAVIHLDVDHFKRYNDQFGHGAGDTLLRWLGHHLQANVRSEDVVCRYGGEEFTVIVPNMTLADALSRANELCESVQMCSADDTRTLRAPVTISLGVSVFPQHGTTPEALIEAADVALYQAKAQGRNRAVAADPLLPAARADDPVAVGDS